MAEYSNKSMIYGRDLNISMIYGRVFNHIHYLWQRFKHIYDLWPEQLTIFGILRKLFYCRNKKMCEESAC